MRTLEGKTALVTVSGDGNGRAIALALSARGVRIVVIGREEKALGEAVGEIAHGGGKARHLAGEPRDALHLAAAVARCIEVFGGLDLVIESDPMNASCTFEAAPPTARRLAVGRDVVVVEGEEPEELAQRVVAACGEI